MFDISWEDPFRETVGQHRDRRQLGDSKSLKRRQSSLKSNNSGASSSSERRLPRLPRMISIFSNSKMTLPCATLTESKPTDLLDQMQTFTISPSSNHEKVNGSLETDESLPQSRARADTSQSQSSSFDGSTFSGWAAQSTAVTSSWSSIIDGCSTHEIQSLSPRSFVTRSTEVTVTSQSQMGTTKLDVPLREVYISADVPNDLSLEIDVEDIRKSAKLDKSKRKPSNVSMGKKKNLKVLELGQIPLRVAKQELWKPPQDWDCKSEDNYSHSVSAGVKNDTNQEYHPYCGSPQSPRMEPSHLKRHIRRMNSATPKIMLERMTEKWPEVPDATIYKDLEFEKQLWMLSSLKYLSEKTNPVKPRKRSESIASPTRRTAETGKVLSLHESEASASYLATFNSSHQTHHLSTTPLSPSLFPSIQPLTVPTPHPNLPYASNLFSTISALTLPITLPSSSLPALLRECNRILLPSGTLNLTILDPCPIASTTGPKMRAWLDSHLLLYLETQFRCTQPSRLLPIWLLDAGFTCRYPASSTLKFWAAGVEIERDREHVNADGINDSLLATVGRMLWKKLWGAYVVGERWWWEDKEVLEECLNLETKWECVLLEAVKRS